MSAGIELPEGNPGAVESAASLLTRAAGAFDLAADTVRRAEGMVGIWRGIASFTFRDHCGTNGEAARAGGDACQRAAMVLRRYGRELEDARQRVRELQRRGEECVRRMDAADARAGAAAVTAAGAELRSFLAGLAGGSDAVAATAAAERDADAARAEQAQAQREAEAAREELRRLQGRAEQERDRIKQRARAAAGSVRGASGLLPLVQHPPPPAKARLKVPDPGESPIDRLFGRDYVLPEEAAGAVLQMGPGSAIWKGIGRIFVGSSSKLPRPAARQTPGGGTWGSLSRHEGLGRGHTIREHVGKSDAHLHARLRNDPRISGASTFTNQAVAEDALSAALLVNGRRVEAFLKSSDTRFRFIQEFDQPVGRALSRGATTPESVRKVFILLVKDKSALGYHIRTSYPTP